VTQFPSRRRAPGAHRRGPRQLAAVALDVDVHEAAEQALHVRRPECVRHARAQQYVRHRQHDLVPVHELVAPDAPQEVEDAARLHEALRGDALADADRRARGVLVVEEHRGLHELRLVAAAPDIGAVVDDERERHRVHVARALHPRTRLSSKRAGLARRHRHNTVRTAAREPTASLSTALAHNTELKQAHARAAGRQQAAAGARAASSSSTPGSLSISSASCTASCVRL
jgi:hypothetical protein